MHKHVLPPRTTNHSQYDDHETEGCNRTRREILKNVVALTGTAYLAPHTISLLLADRASAQSTPPPQQCPGITHTFVNNTGTTMILEAFAYPSGTNFVFTMTSSTGSYTRVFSTEQFTSGFNWIVSDLSSNILGSGIFACSDDGGTTTIT